MWIPSPDSPKPNELPELRNNPPALPHHLPTDIRHLPPDLALVVGRWEGLPEAVRAGIVAMVEAATRGAGPARRVGKRSRRGPGPPGPAE
jgi:hypothetical protein